MPQVVEIVYKVEKTQKKKSLRALLGFQDSHAAQSRANEENRGSDFLNKRQKWAKPSEVSQMLDFHPETKELYLRVLPLESEYLSHFLINLKNILSIEPA